MEHDVRARLRKGEWEQLLPEAKLRVEEALAMRVPESAFLDFDSTMLLKEAFSRRVVEADVHRTTWTPVQREIVEADVAAIAAQVLGVEVALFCTLYEAKGSGMRAFGDVAAIRLAAEAVLARVPQVWAAVNRDLCLCTLDTGSGLRLALDHYAAEDRLELARWGAFVAGSHVGDRRR